LIEENRQQLENFVDGMKAQSVDIMIISPVPTYEYHVPEMLYQKTINSGTQIRRQTVQEYHAQNDDFFKMLVRLNMSKNDVFFPHDYLCAEEYCLLNVDGNPTYFDSNHLTISGAKILSPIFSKIASDIVNVPTN